jgi:hypothetical protein
LRCSTGLDGEFDGQDVPFLSLISDPDSFGREYPNSTKMVNIAQRHSLGSEEAVAPVLTESQLEAANRVLSHRLAVIWGPPGEHS